MVTRLPYLALIFWILFIIQTLAFGGVHTLIFGATLLGFAALLFTFLFTRTSPFFSTLNSLLHYSPLRSATTKSFLFFSLYLTFHSLFLSEHSSWQTFLSYLSSFFLFWVVYLLTLSLSEGRNKDKTFIVKLDYPLLLLAIGVSLIGLSHALSDSGALFGVLFPEHIFRSPRARWPFVNANHLGHFLLPLFLLALSGMLLRMTLLEQNLTSQNSSKKTRFLLRDTLHRRDILHALRSFFLWSCGVFLTLLTISLTLSRSTWFILLLCLFVLLLVYFVREKFVDCHTSQRRSFTQKMRSLPSAILCIIAIIFLFLLWGKGSENIVSRVNQTLSSTHEHIRFQLYSMTLEQLPHAPFFGAGIGEWETFFYKARSTNLLGFDPEYLHCDPIQLLFECGLLAIAPFAFLGIFVIRNTLQQLTDKSISPHIRHLLLFSLLACLSLLGASCFDFTFRIPSLASLLGVLYGHLIIRLEHSNN